MAKQRMPQRLRPVVRYLEGVISNEKAPERLRMQAAERLCELFLESERGKREREVQIARAEARAAEAEAALAGVSTSQADESLKQAATESQAGAQAGASVKEQMSEYLQRTIRNA